MPRARVFGRAAALVKVPRVRGTLERVPALERLPLFPLANVVLFPRVKTPLHIFEPRYRQLTEHALAGERRIGMVAVRPEHLERMRGRSAAVRGRLRRRDPRCAAAPRRPLQHRARGRAALPHRAREPPRRGAALPRRARSRSSRMRSIRRAPARDRAARSARSSWWPSSPARRAADPRSRPKPSAMSTT